MSQPPAVFPRVATAAGLRSLGQFTRVAGSSIAALDAVAWLTHFFNAVYYGVAPERRELENLRIAWTVLTTYWYQLGTDQLGARHVRRLRHSFRDARSRTGSHYPRGLLDHELLAGYMVQRPRFTTQLHPKTAATPGTFGFLLGDAANALHFWPGVDSRAGWPQPFRWAGAYRRVGAVRLPCGTWT